MTSLYSLTGRNGKFVHQELDADGVATGDMTIVTRTTQWAVSPTLATSSEWGDSESAGYTNRASGRKDGTFTAEGKYDTGEDRGQTQDVNEIYDLFQPGDYASAVLWLDGSASPVLASLYWDFPRALCNDFGLTVNIDSEEVIGWTSSWGADGIFYYPGQAGATVRAMPTL